MAFQSKLPIEDRLIWFWVWVSELLNQRVGQGLQTFTFSDLPNATGDYNAYEELDSGIYIFVLETENRMKSKKFTILK